MHFSPFPAQQASFFFGDLSIRFSHSFHFAVFLVLLIPAFGCNTFPFSFYPFCASSFRSALFPGFAAPEHLAQNQLPP
ncbi:MAG: hypothetical protein IPM26_10525 [Saprospiraceae bacterium]|nr:hypothetical protein [Saprospiraceae bacterium]